jgi:hypothetical protein
LAAGQSVTLTVTATVSATAIGSIPNTVTVAFPPVQGAPVDTNLANNQATATIVVLPSKRDFLASNFATTAPLVSRFNMVNVTTPHLFAVGSGPGASPVVTVYNANGTVAGTIMAFAPGFLGGVRVATADVNHDGIDDIIVAAGPGGGPHVRVFDGATGVMIQEFMAYGASFTGGVFVAAADVNHDGFADIITGAGAGGGPHVKVFDGKTGALLASFMAYNPGFTGGVTVAGGDVNGDGFADVVTGAGAGGGPNVRVFDGANTSFLLRDFMAYSPGFGGGVNVAAGDVNGDGKADIITGAGSGRQPARRGFLWPGQQRAGELPGLQRGLYRRGDRGGRGRERRRRRGHHHRRRPQRRPAHRDVLRHRRPPEPGLLRLQPHVPRRGFRGIAAH